MRESRARFLVRPLALLVALGVGVGVATAVTGPCRAEESSRSALVVRRAREEVAGKVAYDRRYVARGTGTPPTDRGACTDLVVRAFGAAGIDLQTKIQLDAQRAPAAYASITNRDGRIDHRRAPNLYVYFARHARKLPTDLGKNRDLTLRTLAPGDVVVWTYGTCPECKADHVGIVSDKIGTRGLPLVIHNAGPRATEEDALDAWPLLGHFRVVE